MTLTERIAKLEIAVENLDKNLYTLKTNHLKHLEERLEKIDDKFTNRLNQINDKISSLSVKVALVTGTMVTAIEIARDLIVK